MRFSISCCVAVAVENALPALKERCDLVTAGDHGGGVIELIERMLADDLQSLGPRRPRKDLTRRRQVRTANDLERAPMEVLVIDIGGSSVKLWHTGHQEHRKFESGKALTPGRHGRPRRSRWFGLDLRGDRSGPALPRQRRKGRRGSAESGARVGGLQLRFGVWPAGADYERCLPAGAG